jgi:hypothetical protein
MEIYVFVQMSGAREAMVVLLLDEADDDLHRSLAHFDARNAQCFKPSDREKLLAVVEASFGTSGPFNCKVRGYFADRLQRTSRVTSSTSTASGTATVVGVEPGVPQPAGSDAAAGSGGRV